MPRNRIQISRFLLTSAAKNCSSWWGLQLARINCAGKVNNRVYIVAQVVGEYADVQIILPEHRIWRIHAPIPACFYPFSHICCTLTKYLLCVLLRLLSPLAVCIITNGVKCHFPKHSNDVVFACAFRFFLQNFKTITEEKFDVKIWHNICGSFLPVGENSYLFH